jgi:hypothetical protein
MWGTRTQPSKDQPPRSSVGHYLLIAFIVVWVVGAYFFLDNSPVAIPNPVPILDASGGLDLTNLFGLLSTNELIIPKPPAFEVRDKYVFGDIVVVKFFYIHAVVLEKSSFGSDSYTILYKDRNHVLQKVVLSRDLLMAPANGTVNPISLLVD